MVRVLGVLAVLALAAAAAVQAQQECDPTKGFLNPDCDKEEKPWCSITDPSTVPATTACTECMVDCDCPIGQFCTDKPGEVGTCSDAFSSKIGKPCRNLNTAQILSSDYDNDWKCAVLYEVSTTGVNTSSTVIDIQGECLNGVCRQCDMRNPNGPPTRGYIRSSRSFTNCDFDSGTGPSRACAYPGQLYDNLGLYWNAAPAYEFPNLVWWPIFITFFFILLILQCILTKVALGGDQV